MKIGIVQFHTSEDILKNIERMKTCILSMQADLLLLPELWICPFENQKIKEAFHFQQKSESMLKECAKQKKMWIIGGTIPYKGENTCLVFNDQGEKIASYSKMHLLEVHARHTYRESDVFKPGNSLCTFDTPWGKAGIIVCYDIRFPELTRILAQEGIQILFLPAAFNQQVGLLHWKPLLQTRAMENEIFVIGASPYYTYKNYQAFGHSLIVDPFGRILYEMKENEEMGTYDIHLEEIQKIRKRMPLWELRRTDIYEIGEKNERN